MKTIDPQLQSELSRTEMDATAEQATINDSRISDEFNRDNQDSTLELEVDVELVSGTTDTVRIPVPPSHNFRDSNVERLMKYVGVTEDDELLPDGATIPITFTNGDVSINYSKMPSTDQTSESLVSVSGEQLTEDKADSMGFWIACISNVILLINYAANGGIIGFIGFAAAFSVLFLACLWVGISPELKNNQQR